MFDRGGWLRLLAFVSLAVLIRVDTAYAIVPAGFEDTVVANVAAPTAIAFTPDGRLLVTTQTGRLMVLPAAGGTVTALDLSSIVCTNSERGLLGVAVDPAFASNRYVYLFYTFNKSGTCDRNTASAPINRVSRFTLPDTNVVSRSSELILLDNILSPNGNHNGGDLHFGRDGFLYISVGDGGCDYQDASRCGGANDAARDQHVLLGKILRITAAGGIPASNPFQGADSDRCNVAGRTQPGRRCRETFAWGLRNPFRLAFDPDASGTRFFINDVGQNVWEEIDEGLSGADYGWNVREGHCANNSTTNCGTAPAGMTNPIFDYAHADGCASITGGAFVPGGIWPAAYNGSYLFSDYVCGSIFRITRNADGSYSRTTFASGLGGSSAVSVIFGPWAGTQALYYTSYAGGGQIRRIAYTTNRAPTATASAAPSAGGVPLTVQLDASGSAEPGDGVLTCAGSFGDGTATATEARVTHTYTTAGRFSAVVTVRDARGASSTASVIIDAGNTPPAPAISSPASTFTFSVGQTVTLTGGASDAQDGTIPPGRLSWSVLLHHDTHTHPFFGPIAGNDLTFAAPAPEDLLAASNSFLEVRLTATDTQGATTTVTRNIQARRVNLSFTSAPAGRTLIVNGVEYATPFTVTSWQDYLLTVSAPTQQGPSGDAWLFSSWSDGGAATHTWKTPSTASTLTAAFASASVQQAQADAYVRNGPYAAQNFGTAQTVDVKHSTGAQYQRRGFIRFPVPAVDVDRAVLRLHGRLSEPGTVTLRAKPVASTAWNELGITWSSQPAVGTTSLASVTIASQTPDWYEWDVTSFVRAERAAGRTVVTLALDGATSTAPFLAIDAREGTAGDPELLISAGGGVSTSDIVMHTAEATAVTGAWRRVTDASAASGGRVQHPDASAAKLAAPLANPANYVELAFTPEPGRPYRLWMRAKADRNFYGNDSVYVQFSNSVTSSGAATARIGTSDAFTYVLEDCSGCVIREWGWQDTGYGAGVLGPTIYFASGGPQTVRIQTREDGLSIDQIVLSPDTYLTRSPGALRDDTTILPRSN